MFRCEEGGNILETEAGGGGVNVYMTGSSMDSKPQRLSQSSHDKYNQKG